jgi:7,8-dihydropterin-6-yl-methyl-4-(beta-D-ribofuranosyl)aminobenzene 5'-phosphate synthase
MELQPIDLCDVTVLVDNVTDLLSSVPGNVTPHSHNLMKAGKIQKLSGTCACCAHWGLSLVIRAKRGGMSHGLLFDSGPEGATVERNGDRLGIDFASIEEVVLSHGHWDHGGGMISALRLIYQANGGKRVPVHVNEGMFVDRGMDMGGIFLPFDSVPSAADMETAGGDIVSNPDPHTALDDMFYVSGEIPRVTPYEVGLPPSHVRKTGQGWEPDRLIMDERYLAVHVQGKGIIVFTACSHAGVVNVLKDARNVFDPVPVYGVMGGLHLSGATMEQIIPDTVRDLRQFNLREIVPGHCTGWRAVHELVGAFGEGRVVPSAVGQSHRF